MAHSVLTAPMATIGVPSEIKVDEQRVALTPDAVRELVTQGLEVRVQSGAGGGAGISDQAFSAAGARMVTREEAWAAHLVVKVKEPQEEALFNRIGDLIKIKRSKLQKIKFKVFSDK